MMPSIFGENLFDEFFNEPFAMVAPQGHNPLYGKHAKNMMKTCLLYTSPSPRDQRPSRMPSSA